MYCTYGHWNHPRRVLAKLFDIAVYIFCSWTDSGVDCVVMGGRGRTTWFKRGMNVTSRPTEVSRITLARPDLIPATASSSSSHLQLLLPSIARGQGRGSKENENLRSGHSGIFSARESTTPTLKRIET
ncbi:hypothetical protein D8B26_000332 [Coccidioides posadasii str. Silveira]|uniref:uncharacterized protein n=1 Tax=Coccidioides posadasii (strain RMSCC 757 / Silveira) TaxID=443226 RepID=UPI001BEF97C4|nr:hypothetical protein D8B26_000332 [Coccidioides posadasii str. Silveira]